MSKSSPILEWSIVRLGDDYNWWVKEISDSVHWDPDGLSIIDPRQVAHLIELVEPLREYGFDPDLMANAFIPFGVDKEVDDGLVRLVRVKDNILESEDQLFALPDIVDEENGPYADFIDHITKMRVKLLNDTFEFEQSLTIDEVEDEIREEQNNNFIEGSAVHLYNEVISVLDYVPTGWEMEKDDGDKALPSDEFEEVEDTQDAAKLKNDASLRWEDEDEDEDVEEYGDGPPPDES